MITKSERMLRVVLKNPGLRRNEVLKKARVPKPYYRQHETKLFSDMRALAAERGLVIPIASRANGWTYQVTDDVNLAKESIAILDRHVKGVRRVIGDTLKCLRLRGDELTTHEAEVVQRLEKQQRMIRKIERETRELLEALAS